jgi:hypothetical protein
MPIAGFAALMINASANAIPAELSAISDSRIFVMCSAITRCLKSRCSHGRGERLTSVRETWIIGHATVYENGAAGHVRAGV